LTLSRRTYAYHRAGPLDVGSCFMGDLLGVTAPPVLRLMGRRKRREEATRTRRPRAGRNGGGVRLKRRPRRKRGPVRQRPKPKGLKKGETSSGGRIVGEARACWAISRDACRIGRLRMNRWPGPNLQSVAPMTRPGFSLCTCSPDRNDPGSFGVPVIGCVANTQRTRGSEGRSVSARTTNGSGGSQGPSRARRTPRRRRSRG
jgi:hypothetical protein